jgi:hypothetical protein
MKNKTNQYKKENDIIVENVLTSENLKMNIQKSHVTIGNGNGSISSEHDELTIAFFAESPCSIEEREFVVANPNEPLVITIRQKNDVERLIKTLEKFSQEIW